LAFHSSTIAMMHRPINISQYTYLQNTRRHIRQKEIIIFTAEFIS